MHTGANFTSTMIPDTSGSDDVLARIEKSLDPESTIVDEDISADEEESTDDDDDSTYGDDETTSTEDTDTGESEEDDEAGDTTEAEDDDSDEGATLESAELAGILGIDDENLIVGEDGSLMVRTNSNGEIGKVSVSDLIKSYQTDATVTQKSQSLAEDRKAFEALKEEQGEVLKARLGETAAVTQLIEAQLQSEYASIDWERLRVESPGEWTAKRQEFTDKVSAINAAKQQAHQVLTQQVGEHNEKAATDRLGRLQAEAEALTAALPEWNDPTVAASQRDTIDSFLTDTYGFDSGVVNLVEDHRLILLALDAQKYRASQKQTDAAVKKIKKLPKLQKPGSKKANAASAARKAKNQKKAVRLKKTGSVQDLQSVLMDRI